MKVTIKSEACDDRRLAYQSQIGYVPRAMKDNAHCCCEVRERASYRSEVDAAWKLPNSVCKKGQWANRKYIVMLTTKYNAGLLEKTKTFGNKTKFCDKPLHSEKRNEKMDSVDFADQLLEPYTSARKSLARFIKIDILMLFRMVSKKCYFCTSWEQLRLHLATKKEGSTPRQEAQRNTSLWSYQPCFMDHFKQ